jgi:hypothetical protein
VDPLFAILGFVIISYYQIKASVHTYGECYNARYLSNYCNHQYLDCQELLIKNRNSTRWSVCSDCWPRLPFLLLPLICCIFGWCVRVLGVLMQVHMRPWRRWPRPGKVHLISSRFFCCLAFLWMPCSPSFMLIDCAWYSFLCLQWALWIGSIGSQGEFVQRLHYLMHVFVCWMLCLLPLRKQSVLFLMPAAMFVGFNSRFNKFAK